ncbi:phosphate acyltransferase PlsX [Hugonella massiliensis]|uniref:phosphate acyltransferase PlsX n=1 Tax=Hugonella massiliensis TaxID=1720315 RepID=UPI00073E3046|nr:phosphate acyltransferase PlsX [Hugonella massiliensis]
MSETVTIAVDAIGGDAGASVVLPGVEAALAADTDLAVLLCGPADVVEPFAAAHDRCEAVVCTEEIAMGEHPAQAVRKKKDSSIVVGCRKVKEGAADGFFSAGSTGAVMSAGTLMIGRIRGVKRPALCTVLPAPSQKVLLCDCGANADCKPEYLLQFGQMASIYAEKVMGIAQPRVALLNIGSEEAKGSALAQEAHALLAAHLPTFVGNGEGTDVLSGRFDVFVADGFTGNVCLKTIEGTAGALMGALKGVFKKNALTMLAAALVKGGLSGLKQSLSADSVGAAPLLGVKGACTVGHGSSNETAIKNGVLTTAAIARAHVSDLIAQEVQPKSA